MGECLITRRGGEPYKLPTLSTSFPKNSTVNSGTNAIFVVEFAEHGKPANYTYQWYVNSQAVSGATNSSYTRNTSSDNGVYSIYCEVTSKAGTVKSRIATLTVNKLPALNGSYPANATVTSGTNATFEVAIFTAGYPTSYTYQWYVNNEAVNGATSSIYTRATSSDKDTYSVYCKVTNAAGSVNSRTATLTVNKTPMLNTSYPVDASVTIGGNSTTLSVIISTAGYPISYTYQWYKDGNAISGATSSTYTFTPTVTGTTTFYCKVTNTAGSVTSRTAIITCNPLYLYNAGDQCISLTGGWNQGIKPGSSYANSGSHTINSDNITIKSPTYGAWAIYTKNKINLTNYSKITVEFSGPKLSDDAILRLFAMTDFELSDYEFANVSAKVSCHDSSATLISVNVSSVSKSNYIAIGYSTNVNDSSTGLKIYKVYLS